MMLLPCPHCGPRGVSEFAYLGEVTSRPDPSSATPAEWRGYLHFHRNRAGWARETWMHRAGCRRYFQLERDSTTNECRPGEPAQAEGADV